MNRLAKSNLVDRQRDHVTSRIPARARVGNLVKKAQDGSTMDIPCEIRHVWRHENGHAEFPHRRQEFITSHR